MKNITTTVHALFLLLVVPACPNTDSGPTTDNREGETSTISETDTTTGSSTSDAPSTSDSGGTGQGDSESDGEGSGEVPCAVGLPCETRADCGEELRLDCFDGTCAIQCATSDIGSPCRVGWCDTPLDSTVGICRSHEDGEIDGACYGVPSCAGDPCTDSCERDLSCVKGVCIAACVTSEDCPAGACVNEACVDSDGLVDDCN